MDKHVVVIACAIAGLAGCGPKLISKPAADPAIVVDGNDLIAVGSAIPATVTWDATCEGRTTGGDGNGAPGPYPLPCNPVPHTVSFQCEHDACTWTATHDHGYMLVPAKSGIMRAVATVTRKGGTAKSYPIEPIQVVVPDGVTLVCFHAGDSDNVRLTLTHAGASVRAAAPTLEVNGHACTYDHVPAEPDVPMAGDTNLSYTCGVSDTAHAKITTPSLHLEVSAACT